MVHDYLNRTSRHGQNRPLESTALADIGCTHPCTHLHGSWLQRNRICQHEHGTLLHVLTQATRPPAVARPPGKAAAAPTSEAEPEPAPVEEEDDEEDVSFSDPYINSILCTTCNECTNINPRMFRYNANKQATLADLAAGTFKQLVLAAEKCPARCIHPGSPRPDDPTVTPDLVARARNFA